MRYRIVETCNFGRDYPEESFLPIPNLSKEDAEAIAKIINDSTSLGFPRYWKVVPVDYKLDNQSFQP